MCEYKNHKLIENCIKIIESSYTACEVLKKDQRFM